MSADFARKAAKSFFGIVVALALMTFVFVSVEADFDGSSCVCYYAGPCETTADGVPVRWYQCTGACSAYSQWRYDSRCMNPDWQPRPLLS